MIALCLSIAAVHVPVRHHRHHTRPRVTHVAPKARTAQVQIEYELTEVGGERIITANELAALEAETVPDPGEPPTTPLEEETPA